MELVSEKIEPIGAFDVAAMGHGEPGLPEGFRWRGQDYQIESVLETGKKVGHDRTHGSDERYVHRHQFKVRASGGQVMNIYFDRQAKSWWLHSIEA